MIPDVKVTDVRCHKGDSAFLLQIGSTAILYDSGFGFTGSRVAENVKAVLGSQKLNYIFLTHSHYDHALGSANVLRCFPEAKVAAGRYAADIFSRPGARALMKELDAGFAAACGVQDYEFLGDELRVDLPCSDGDRIVMGDLSFEVLDLPGHTRCSVGYYCPQLQLLLACETLGVYDGAETIVPVPLVSYAESLRSIDRVLQLPVKSILAPHLGILSPEQSIFFFSHMKEAAQSTAAEVLRQLRQGVPEDQIVERFKDRFWHGYIREIYPADAINLNTAIMIRLIRKELLDADK